MSLLGSKIKITFYAEGVASHASMEMIFGKNFTAVIRQAIITNHLQAKEPIKSVPAMLKDIPDGVILWNLLNRRLLSDS